MSIKPKLQIHTCLYILTQTFMTLKHEPIINELIQLAMGTKISTDHLEWLHKKELL
jgi:hypothetical protein